MGTPFDIFRISESDGVIWLEACADLEAAKARVAELMQARPCEYMIFSQTTQHKLSIKPSDGG
jgi:hypothetical protein